MERRDAASAATTGEERRDRMADLAQYLLDLVRAALRMWPDNRTLKG
jgi:hypothetical protein